VGAAVGVAVGVAVGATVGVAVGGAVGDGVGGAVGLGVGISVGVGGRVGSGVGGAVGLGNGLPVGLIVGVPLGVGVEVQAARTSTANVTAVARRFMAYTPGPFRNQIPGAPPVSASWVNTTIGRPPGKRASAEAPEYGPSVLDVSMTCSTNAPLLLLA
jgi:hypothetical protein